MAARLKKQQQRVNLEPPRPMAARLIKKAVSITLSVYYCLNNFWRRNIISCVIRSPADYMAEWENVPLDPKTTKRKKKQRANLELPRPMAARLKKTEGRALTALGLWPRG